MADLKKCPTEGCVIHTPDGTHTGDHLSYDDILPARPAPSETTSGARAPANEIAYRQAVEALLPFVDALQKMTGGQREALAAEFARACLAGRSLVQVDARAPSDEGLRRAAEALAKDWETRADGYPPSAEGPPEGKRVWTYCARALRSALSGAPAATGEQDEVLNALRFLDYAGRELMGYESPERIPGERWETFRLGLVQSTSVLRRALARAEGPETAKETKP